MSKGLGSTATYHPIWYKLTICEKKKKSFKIFKPVLLEYSSQGRSQPHSPDGQEFTFLNFPQISIKFSYFFL